jgi:hypothetical protein
MADGRAARSRRFCGGRADRAVAACTGGRIAAVAGLRVCRRMEAEAVYTWVLIVVETRGALKKAEGTTAPMHVYNRAVLSNLGPLGPARIWATRLETLVQALHPRFALGKVWYLPSVAAFSISQIFRVSKRDLMCFVPCNIVLEQ